MIPTSQKWLSLPSFSAASVSAITTQLKQILIGNYAANLPSWDTPAHPVPSSPLGCDSLSQTPLKGGPSTAWSPCAREAPVFPWGAQLPPCRSRARSKPAWMVPASSKWEVFAIHTPGQLLPAQNKHQTHFLPKSEHFFKEFCILTIC